MGKKKLSFKDIMVNYGVIIIMILLVIYTGFTSKNFLSGNNLNNILMNMSSRIVIALGIAGCIITAGCDLSAGRMIGFGGCIAGTLLQKMDYSKKFFPDMEPLNIFVALFGSYSIPITVAGIPSLFLLKSMILYFCLDPPP